MESVTSRDGTTIAHETYGQGPPLITVCGATCDRALMRPTAQALSQHFTTVNYDRRGRLCQGSLSGHSGTLPWWLLEGVEADDRAGQHGQRVEPFGISLVADGSRRKLPSQAPLCSIVQRWRPSRCDDSIMRRAIRGRMPRRRR
jgi:hypothetical protein